MLGTGDYKVQLCLSALNLTNKEALYNYLSTFSGTSHRNAPLKSLGLFVRLVIAETGLQARTGVSYK
ncbi:MAG TPA: hypothetical protein VG273_14520 [Bryobacteraceae bacterium]|nr:hypothetical protein [Bryobacteraceae bacterium]